MRPSIKNMSVVNIWSRIWSKGKGGRNILGYNIWSDIFDQKVKWGQVLSIICLWVIFGLVFDQRANEANSTLERFFEEANLSPPPRSESDLFIVFSKSHQRSKLILYKMEFLFKQCLPKQLLFSKDPATPLFFGKVCLIHL